MVLKCPAISSPSDLSLGPFPSSASAVCGRQWQAGQADLWAVQQLLLTSSIWNQRNPPPTSFDPCGCLKATKKPLSGCYLIRARQPLKCNNSSCYQSCYQAAGLSICYLAVASATLTGAVSPTDPSARHCHQCLAATNTGGTQVPPGVAVAKWQPKKAAATASWVPA